MSRHRMTDAEHTAELRAEMEAAGTPADQLALMRFYLIEFDRASERFPELDCDKSRQVRAELVEEIARLEHLNKHWHKGHGS
jgi:hypothetical protein